MQCGASWSASWWSKRNFHWPVQVLQGRGDLGAATIEAGPDKVSFTGSVATGQRIAEACAKKLSPGLELAAEDGRSSSAPTPRSGRFVVPQPGRRVGELRRNGDARRTHLVEQALRRQFPERNLVSKTKLQTRRPRFPRSFDDPPGLQRKVEGDLHRRQPNAGACSPGGQNCCPTSSAQFPQPAKPPS